MNPLTRFHETHIHARRVQVLGSLLAGQIPEKSSVLDVGCGDGALAASIAARRLDVRIEGIDTKVRPAARIPAREFDGVNLPCADQSVDVAMFVDVLHHAEDPLALLRDARRVVRQKILIKDHLRDGVLANLRLRLMDWMGNARYGVTLPYRYWTRAEWVDVFGAAGLHEEAILSGFHLYRLPLEWVFGGRLHFVAVLTPKRGSR